MTDIHGGGATATALSAVNAGGISWGTGGASRVGGGADEIGNAIRLSLFQAGLDLHAQGPSVRDSVEPDLGLRKGYMRALMQFADDEDIDVDSPARHGGGEGQHPARLRDEPRAPTSGSNLNAGAVTSKPAFSFRISHVPFTWQPDEVSEPKPDRQNQATPRPTNTEETHTPAMEGSYLGDMFGSLAFGPSEDLQLIQLPGIEPPSGRKRSLSAVSVGLGTVQEGAVMPFSNANPPVAIAVPDLDAWEERGAAVGRRQFLRPSMSTGRPSTATTQSSSSFSMGSGGEEQRGKRKPSPRRSNDFFRRFRGRTNEDHHDFIERRSLTPRDLAAAGPHQDDVDIPDVPDIPDLDRAMARLDNHAKPKPVFGVELDESIRLAPMKIRISHRGSSTSYRTFPLSVYKCCEFIRTSPLTDPNLFSSPGDAFNVSQLRDIFNAPPYGEGFSFSAAAPQYTPHDAARLVLLYLQSLPNPLVSASVVKSWILLARQEGAIEPPCPRPIESGLDFWAEALNRLPLPNRNLTKHLLTLFAEMVTRKTSKGTVGISDVDARALAAAVAGPMFKFTGAGVKNGGDESGRGRGYQAKSSGTKEVHATLALAFLVKKRGEYMSAMERGSMWGTGKRENGDGDGFLPSTREILEWKSH